MEIPVLKVFVNVYVYIPYITITLLTQSQAKESYNNKKNFIYWLGARLCLTFPTSMQRQKDTIGIKKIKKP